MYSSGVIVPSATYVRPFSQLAVSSGFKELPHGCLTDIKDDLSEECRRRDDRAFFANARYLMLNSFFQDLRAGGAVPIPLPLIWARRSSSSMS